MQRSAPIIIIDDDSLIRFMLSTALQGQGLTTMEAASGEEGLKLFEQYGAEAVLVDVVMPNGMDGFETCSEFRIRTEGEHLPILMMTGLEDMESINRAYEAGATDFITKPLNIPLLAYRLRYMLRANDTTKRLLDSESRLHRMAYFDTLTDLPNRQFFYEHLQQMLSVSQRKGLKLAVLFLDLDNFKRINDTLGHYVGDQVLQETARRLRGSIRVSDMMVRNGVIPEGNTLARLGGDEFTLLLSLLETSEHAAVAAERIRCQISQPFIIEDQELYITTSIGISLYPDNGEVVRDLLKNADMAMYYSKRDGGNRYSFFSAEMTQTAVRRMTLENHLRKALEQNELSLHYQPLMDIKSGRFSSVEALVHWRNEELGLIPADEFIPLAEETGLIIPIGEWILRRVCAQVKEWLDEGLPLSRVAVNISAVQLLHKGFPALIEQLLQESGLSHAILELELTEAAIVSTEDQVLEMLREIKKTGVQLAIDDFGIGYSSLSKLPHFPIDRLKIDQTFIRHLEDDEKNGAIASAIITLSASLGMAVTAKGVETESQLNFLKEKNCTEAQGSYLSKALGPKEAAEFINHSLEKSFQ